MINYKNTFDYTTKNISGNSPVEFEKFSDKDLYKYCKMVGFNARKWHRRFIAALPEVAKRRLYKKYGYCSIHEFAAKMAGVSRDNVDDVLRVSEKLAEMPMLKTLIAEIGLNKVRLIANIAKPETENYWAEKIQNMTKSSLRIFINEYFRSGTEDKKTAKIPQGEGQSDLFNSESFRSQTIDTSNSETTDASLQIRSKKTFTIKIDDETEFELRKFKKHLERDRKEPVDWNFTLKEMVKRANNDQKVLQKLPDQKYISTSKPCTKTVSRAIPAKIKHELKQKYNGCCAYSGCNKPAEQIHHPESFASRPNHDNLTPLCKEHHDFVHQNANRWTDNKFKMFKLEKRVASG